LSEKGFLLDFNGEKWDLAILNQLEARETNF
jgi:hypothetical protein